MLDCRVAAAHDAGDHFIYVGAVEAAEFAEARHPLVHYDATYRALAPRVSAGDPTRAFRLDGRVAVVTGASSGIGEALAEGLAAAGAKVVLAARRLDRLDALAARIVASGAETHAVACDVARRRRRRAPRDRDAGSDSAASMCSSTTPASDGRFPPSRSRIDHFDAVMRVNLGGTFRCAQRFGREMLAQGSGSIVNVASILGVVGCRADSAGELHRAKGAVVNLTRELAAQWARRGVRVNALAPAWFPSEMTAEMFADERATKWMRQRTPMGRAGRVEELVGPLLFLASDAASYVTGHILLVDGGWTCV